MKKAPPRLMISTTKHMHHKIFMLSQKLGMVQGSPISVTKLAKDAVIDYFDLNNDEKWDEVRAILTDTMLTALDVAKIGEKTKEKNNGKTKKH